MEDPQDVLSLEQWLPPNPGQLWPLELVEAGGRIWIGANDGRFLFVEPFGDPSNRPIYRGQLWPGKRSRLRARVADTWMLIFSDYGIKAFNLLSLDDSRSVSVAPIDVWSPKLGEILIGDPILLRSTSDSDLLAGLDRTVVFVTTGPDDKFVLWTYTMSLDAARSKQRGWRIQLTPQSDSDGRKDERQRLILVDASTVAARRVLLATQREVFLMVISADGVNLRAERQLNDLRLIIHQDDIPSVVYSTGGSRLNGEEMPGRMFFVQQEGAELPRRVLYAATIVDGDKAALSSYPDYGGLPLSSADFAGMLGVLCLHGQSLSLCDWLGHTIPIGSSEHLGGTTRGATYGRLAICSGSNLRGDSNQWFTVFLDMSDRRLLTSLLSLAPMSTPQLIGCHVFTLDTVPGRLGLSPSQQVWLRRRRLTVRA